MELGLKNKVALISASSKGIGKGVALALAKEGVNVSILGRSAENLETAIQEIKEGSNVEAIATVCDINNSNNIEQVYRLTLEKLGRIDILINNQGGPKPGNFEDISLDEIRDAISACLMPNFAFTKLCLPDMVKNNWGRIVNILSISAKEPLPGMFLSNMIRPAVLGFTKSLSTTYADKGITMNSVLPSAVLTERTGFFVKKKASENRISYNQALLEIAKNLPPKYIASVNEFATNVVYLCSENASYINGTAIPVDGGLSKGLY